MERGVLECEKHLFQRLGVTNLPQRTWVISLRINELDHTPALYHHPRHPMQHGEGVNYLDAVWERRVMTFA